MYKKVLVQKCKDVTGKMPMKVRWIDTNKQDEVNPKHRSRIVAKGFKRCNDPDFFSSTLPTEMLRYIGSTAATGKSRKGRIRNIMANDVARSYFISPGTSSVFVELCEKDRGPEDEGKCGELSVSMHGTRSAA